MKPVGTHRDFGWWLRLAAIAAVIAFAAIFLTLYDGMFRSWRIFSITIKSLVGAVGVAGAVALVGHFVSSGSPGDAD